MSRGSSVGCSCTYLECATISSHPTRQLASPCCIRNCFFWCPLRVAQLPKGEGIPKYSLTATLDFDSFIAEPTHAQRSLRRSLRWEATRKSCSGDTIAILLHFSRSSVLENECIDVKSSKRSRASKLVTFFAHYFF